MCIIIMNADNFNKIMNGKYTRKVIGKNGRNPKEFKNAENLKQFLNNLNFNNQENTQENTKPKPKPKPKPTQKNEQKSWEQKLKNAKTKKEIRKIFLEAVKELHPNRGGTKANFNKIYKLYTNLYQRT